jgi:hypothetical protein
VLGGAFQKVVRFVDNWAAVAEQSQPLKDIAVRKDKGPILLKKEKRNTVDRDIP